MVRPLVTALPFDVDCSRSILTATVYRRVRKVDFQLDPSPSRLISQSDFDGSASEHFPYLARHRPRVSLHTFLHLKYHQRSLTCRPVHDHRRGQEALLSSPVLSRGPQATFGTTVAVLTTIARVAMSFVESSFAAPRSGRAASNQRTARNPAALRACAGADRLKRWGGRT